MLKVPKVDAYGRTLNNFKARAAELRKVLKITNEDRDTMSFMYNHKRFAKGDLCPYNFNTEEDFFIAIVECVNMGDKIETAQRRFQQLMLIINLTKFRLYNEFTHLSARGRPTPFMRMYDPYKLMIHYEIVLDGISQIAKILEGTFLFRRLFFTELKSINLRKESMPRFLCELYGAVLTNKSPLVASATREFIRNKENFVMVECEHRIALLTRSYERSMEEFRKQALETKVRQLDPEINIDTINAWEREKEAIKKKNKAKKEKWEEKENKMRLEYENLELQLEEEKKLHQETKRRGVDERGKERKDMETILIKIKMENEKLSIEIEELKLRNEKLENELKISQMKASAGESKDKKRQPDEEDDSSEDSEKKTHPSRT